ncbi:MAG: hypothetical protein PHF50_00065 [Patescibacteria group bacterium]|nr:hypothetical protein [Patescibacteria group bacterium]
MKRLLILTVILPLLLILGCTQTTRQANETAPIIPVQPAENSAQPLVGNDRDEHGCIGSAGYSWCAAKQKCIRVFEEDCLSAESIKSAIALKYKKPISQVFIRIDKENTEYAKGGVSFAPKGGAGGMFLAAKINGKWELVYDGNGSVDCRKIKANYNFPADMLVNFCD